ncbi:MAG: site-2 protease family protein [Anaerolineales bacterium]|nr:site-2 protease family protein [Anaerolineales bacterium]
MGSSIPLFSVQGITIRMHITFPLILIWGALQFGVFTGGGWSGAIFGLIVTFLLFAIVVLHELGHSLAALRYGVPVKQIVLLPIGGVAELGRMPEKPIQEFVIAIAGPLVNFALAIILAPLGLALGQGFGGWPPADLFDNLGQLSFNAIFNYVFVSNLFLGIFNLLPAFPMDGGRVLRALLATQVSYQRATSIAVTIGQTLAWMLGLYGFLNGNFFTILIAVFIFSGAEAERQLVQTRSVLGDLMVEQAYSRRVQTLTPQSSLRDAVKLTFDSFQADFPVCEGEQLVGLLTYTRLLEALDQHGPNVPVGKVMLTHVSPVAPDDNLFAAQQRLAESNLEALPVVADGRFLGLLTNRDIGEVYRIASTQPDLIATLKLDKVKSLS